MRPESSRPLCISRTKLLPVSDVLELRKSRMAGLLQHGDDFAGVGFVERAGADEEVPGGKGGLFRWRPCRCALINLDNLPALEILSPRFLSSSSRSLIHLFAAAGPASRSSSGTVAKTSSISSGSDTPSRRRSYQSIQTCQSSSRGEGLLASLPPHLCPDGLVHWARAAALRGPVPSRPRR